MKNWTEKDIKELHRKGKVRNYRPRTKEIRDPGVNVRKVSKEKDWIEFNLAAWCNDHALTLETEYRFHPTRKWRFDYSIPALKWAAEYEGIFSQKSRHTNRMGYVKDAEKYREAAKQGWTLMRYTAVDYQDIIRDLDEIYKQKINTKCQEK